MKLSRHALPPECALCVGTGIANTNHGPEVCPVCDGDGQKRPDCPTCRGVGKVVVERRATFWQRKFRRSAETIRVLAECHACMGKGHLPAIAQGHEGGP